MIITIILINNNISSSSSSNGGMTSTGVEGGEIMGPRAGQTCEYTSTLS